MLERIRRFLRPEIKDEGLRLGTVVMLFVGMSILVGVVPMAALHGHMGDFPVWWTASSTALAFAAAMLAAFLAFDATRRERERDDERDEDKRRAQADLVAAWVEGFGIGQVKTNDGSTRYFTSGNSALRVINSSPLPVMNVKITADLICRRPGNMQIVKNVVERSYDLLPPTEERAKYRLRPDELDGITGRVEELREAGYDFRTDINLVASMIFTDCAGRHWIRGTDGQLKPAPDHLAQLRDSGRR